MDERVYFAYIVASKSRTLYIGMTGDLRVRVYQHKEKLHADGFAGTYNSKSKNKNKSKSGSFDSAEKRSAQDDSFVVGTGREQMRTHPPRRDKLEARS